MKIKNLKFILFVSFSFLVLSFTFLSGCKSQVLYRDNRLAMGTSLEVISPYEKASKIVFAEINRIEDLLSRYKPDSEVSKLNKNGSLKVSNETFYIIKKSKEFYWLTNGSFDITCAPLLDIWGFTGKQYKVPEPGEIKNALRLVGSDKIILHDSDNMIQFKLPGMKIDLGGVAKGYALDSAIKKLKENNIDSCLINLGGQVYCLGSKFGRSWVVRIKSPRGRGIGNYLELKDKSAATSGDYEQYFIEDGIRYSHIFNPKTGYPADSGIKSVTIVAKDGLTADALSTSVFVLGKDKGNALLKKFKDARAEII